MRYKKLAQPAVVFSEGIVKNPYRSITDFPTKNLYALERINRIQCPMNPLQTPKRYFPFSSTDDAMTVVKIDVSKA